jgi:hypothetical protein
MQTPKTINHTLQFKSNDNAKIANLNTFYATVDTAALHILYRLSGHLTDIFTPQNDINNTQNTQKSNKNSPIKSQNIENKSLIYQIINKKLSVFLTLKRDEQISLSSIIQQFMNLNSILLITTQPINDIEYQFCKQIVTQFLELLKICDMLWKQISTFLVKIPQNANKLTVTKKLLTETAKQILNNNTNNTNNTNTNNAINSGYSDKNNNNNNNISQFSTPVGSNKEQHSSLLHSVSVYVFSGFRVRCFLVCI